MIVMNVVYAGFAYPAGVASDRFSHRALLLGGLAVLITSDMTLALATGSMLVLLGAALWGLHMALTQGLLAKLVADTAPAELRGTGFGLFNLASGGAVECVGAIRHAPGRRRFCCRGGSRAAGVSRRC
jgi:MFS family permease